METIIMTGDFAMNLMTGAEQTLGSIPLPMTTTEPLSDARPMRWKELDGQPAATQRCPSKADADEMIGLYIELGRTHIDQDEVQKLRAGAVVPLDSSAGDPVDVYAGGRLIARGEVVVLDGKMGIRVTETMLKVGETLKNVLHGR
jgi:flagellar motor switch protein FliN